MGIHWSWLLGRFVPDTFEGWLILNGIGLLGIALVAIAFKIHNKRQEW